jgi:hypothetical protein
MPTAEGEEGLKSFSGGTGAPKDSDLLTRCTLGSGNASPLLLLIIDMEEAEVYEARLRVAEKEERVLRVDELGVEGLMREGRLLGRPGEDNRRG